MNQNFRREFYLAFILGCSIGILSSLLWYLSAFGHGNHLSRQDTDMGYSHNGNEKPPNMSKKNMHLPILFNDLDSIHHKGGDEIALRLSEKIRVLCWVLTSPETILKKGQAVKDTWGKRCNVLVFISSKEDKKFPAVGVNVPEGHENLWLKTRAAWKYVYDNHYNDADWFIKADDETFVVLENLRYFLIPYNSNEMRYFGRHFVYFGGYNSGGAGYVFSKKTLNSFVNVMNDTSKCKRESANEDAEVGACLRAVGIHPEDTRDELQRQTFHPLSPVNHLIPGKINKDSWLHSYNKWPEKYGLDCCSDHSITFHSVAPNEMYLLEYLIYHLHPYGIHHAHE